MRAAGFREEWLRRRREVQATDGFRAHKGEWLDCGSQGAHTPIVFLIEQPANSLLRTHFHRQNQFQLFVRGSGSLGPHPLAPYTLHYAGAYTGYGPITAGPEGLAYLTLRATFDSGASFVPEALPRMVRGPKRQAHTRPFGATEPGCVLMSSADDELLAERLALPPHACAVLEPQAAGLFVVVLEGSLDLAGWRLGPWENAYFSADEAPSQAVAGAQGCALLTLRMPALAAEYRAAA